jgi:hypothetical protein
MFESTAIVRYGSETKVFALIDPAICEYYRSLIPKYYYPKPQYHKPHITIIRSKKESPTNLDNWGRHDGRLINFRYSPYVHYDGVYFWLNAYSPQIEEIRLELGLPRFRDDREFGGILRQEYHITIANTK